MNEKNKPQERANAPRRKFTAEEVAKSLRRSAYGADEHMELVAADMLEAQAKRIAELEEERRWIPVTERLPDLDDGTTLLDEEMVAVQVLVMIQGVKESTCLYFDGEDFFDYTGDELIPYRVTHWKPMPKGTEAAP